MTKLTKGNWNLFGGSEKEDQLFGDFGSSLILE